MYKEKISVGEVFSKVFSIRATNIGKFIGIILVPGLVLLVMSFLLGLIATGAAIGGISVGGILLIVIVCSLVILLLCIPLSIGTYYVARKYHDTQEITFSNILICFRENMILKSIGLSLLIGIILIVGYILFIVPGIILTYMFIFAFFVMVDNPELGILDIISLSAKLSKGYKLKAFGYTFLLGIIPALLSLLLRGTTLGGILSLVLSLIIGALNLLGLSFFYIDSLGEE
ncbi:DUF975 family protein [Clostridium hydrogenum]|uniref:hypothetical protein n=1 Tax=Clostridium hydrogenum TaxID=2855764 RepID=UPI001F3447C5|nr:hypothetical protein [Clostridium hydrogenum]